MIGILSDTHDNLDAVRSAVQVFKDAGCSLVIHAGDFVAPFAARELGKVACPVRAVYGNCDGEKAGLAEAVEPFGMIQEAPLIIRLGRLSILVTHSAGGPGASPGVRLSSTRPGLQFTDEYRDGPARESARRGTYDVVIFGHTHRPEIGRKGRTLVINPGEACGWLSGIKTIALLNPATLSAEILPL